MYKPEVSQDIASVMMFWIYMHPFSAVL